MTDLSFRTLVWLTYRLGVTFGLTIPLILLIWATIKKEFSIIRLLSIYLKVSSLILISILLLTGNRSIGYLTSFISPVLILISIWFWTDLNDEIRALSNRKALAFSIKLWRCVISIYSLLYLTLTFQSLSCIKTLNGNLCLAWQEGPQNLHILIKSLFNFLFGASWTEPIAGFIGYILLIAYTIGILQIIAIRLPKQGRIAGDF
tara:strand:- start:492 stop:1103 length:612 start_codon:yes stop_codon:yes gene_type:complete